MQYSLMIATVLGLPAAASADDPPAPRPAAQPAQPRAVQPAQPPGFRVDRLSPFALARYEEEAEVLEAQLAVKHAYVKAAEVGVTGAKGRFNQLAALRDKAAITADKVEQARFDVEAATAQLDIRKAEMKEVEVKLKHARKRLDELKNAPARPNPARGDRTERKPADPQP